MTSTADRARLLLHSHQLSTTANIGRDPNNWPVPWLSRGHVSANWINLLQIPFILHSAPSVLQPCYKVSANRVTHQSSSSSRWRYIPGWALASSTICLQASHSLLCLSIHLHPSFSGPWTRHPTISFLVFLFVLLHTVFRTTSLLRLRCLVFFLYDQAIAFFGI